MSEFLNIYLGLGKPIPHLKPDLRMGRLSDRHLQVKKNEFMTLSLGWPLYNCSVTTNTIHVGKLILRLVG